MGYVASAGAPELLSSLADSQLIFTIITQTFPTVFKKSDKNSSHPQMHRWPSFPGDFVKSEVYTIWGEGFFKEKNTKSWI